MATFFLLCGHAGAQTTLIATGSVWRYLDNGSDQGTAWAATNFNDTAWAAGPAQLGYGDGDEATVVSYGGVSANKYITTYFRRPFLAVGPVTYTNLFVRLLRDDGVVVYLNGIEVFRSNMPNGPIGYRTTALTTASDDGTNFQVRYINPGLLVTGTNIVAAEIHQSTNNSSDISFELELTANVLALPFTAPTMTRWPVTGTTAHFYEAVATSGIIWSNASLAASNRGGYLATVTSTQENQMIFELIRTNANLWIRRPSTDSWGPWLGGFQKPGSVEPDGGWTWVTGEPFAYQHWDVGEPNNNLGIEDRIHFLGNKSPYGNVWNDSTGTNGAIRSYVVEYEQNLEPAPLVELLFDETGTNAVNSGTSGVKANLFDATGANAELHSSYASGLSGLPGDLAFDNSSASGMGSSGSSGRALLPGSDTSVDGLISLTLQGWFKAESVIGANARLVDKQVGNDGFILLASASGTLSFEINNVPSTMSSAQFAETGTWVFFVVTYDGTLAANNVKFYKGDFLAPAALLETRTLNQGRAVANARDVIFGNAGLQRPFDGLLDSVRIFGSKTDAQGVLTQAQLEWFRNKDVQHARDLPATFVARTNGAIQITWPRYPGGYQLETATKLTPPALWLPVTNAPSVTGNQNAVQLIPTNGFRAFRLRR